MVRLMFPLLPFRLAGVLVSSGWGDEKWWAFSLYLGANRFMLHIGKAGLTVRHVKGGSYPSVSCTFQGRVA